MIVIFHDIQIREQRSLNLRKLTCSRARDFRSFSDTRFANICEIPARAVIACKAAYLLILCVLARFARNPKHALKRVRIPLGSLICKSHYAIINIGSTAYSS